MITIYIYIRTLLILAGKIARIYAPTMQMGWNITCRDVCWTETKKKKKKKITESVEAESKISAYRYFHREVQFSSRRKKRKKILYQEERN